MFTSQSKIKYTSYIMNILWTWGSNEIILTYIDITTTAAIGNKKLYGAVSVLVSTATVKQVTANSKIVFTAINILHLKWYLYGVIISYACVEKSDNVLQYAVVYLECIYVYINASHCVFDNS